MKKILVLLMLILFAGLVWNISRRSPERSETNAIENPRASAILPARKAKAVPAALPDRLATEIAPANRSWRVLLASNDFSALRLSREEIWNYLAANQTNAESLMIAFQLSNDREFLRMAATNFPNDPFVQYNIVAHDVFPEARGEWLERFKQGDPGNALANYYSARDLVKQGKTDQALQELVSASQKSGYKDYTREKMIGVEEALLQSGRSPAEAKATGMSSIFLPSLANMKDLGRELAALQQQYTQNGDVDSAYAMARMGLELGRHLDTGPASQTLISQLVGLAVERMSVNKLDPNQEYDFLGGTAAQHLAQIDATRKGLRELSLPTEQWLLTASEADIISYSDRLKMLGEPAALLWLHQRLGQR